MQQGVIACTCACSTGDMYSRHPHVLQSHQTLLLNTKQHVGCTLDTHVCLVVHANSVHNPVSDSFMPAHADTGIHPTQIIANYSNIVFKGLNTMLM